MKPPVKLTRIVVACLMSLGAFTVPSMARTQDRVAAQNASDSISSFMPQELQPPLESRAEPALSPDESLSALLAGDRGDMLGWSRNRILEAAAAMLGAIILSVPITCIYLRTKPHHEFDSSVLFSIVILAALIAGVLVVIQGSIATALSLAGVVTAVRFRSSLKDSNDAVYLLGAIAIGLAAGSRALDIALVISVVLSATLLLLWKVRLDVVRKALMPKEDRKHGGHHHDQDRERGSSEQPAKPIPLVQETTGHSRDVERDAEPSPRLGYFVIETNHPERTRLLVEMFLERETKRWRLDGSTGNGNGDRDGRGIKGLLRDRDANGHTTLMYLVRFRKHTQPEALLERIRAVGAPAEFTVELETETSLT